jgi:hypothetical protein
MITGIIGAIVAFVAGMLLQLGISRKEQGKLEEQAEIARKDALLQKQMAAVPAPSKDETLSRLDDGTA